MSEHSNNENINNNVNNNMGNNNTNNSMNNNLNNDKSNGNLNMNTNNNLNNNANDEKLNSEQYNSVQSNNNQTNNAQPNYSYQNIPHSYPQQGTVQYAQPMNKAIEYRLTEDPKLAAMRENYNYYGLATLIYSVFYTFCLYKNTSGITAPFFVAGTLIYFYVCMKKSGIKLKKDTFFYAIAIELLGINLCITKDSTLIAFDYIGLILLTISGLLHIMYDDKKWEFGKYFENIMSVIFGSLGYLFRAFSDMSFYKKMKSMEKAMLNVNNGNQNQTKKKEGIVKYVVIGFFSCLPILGIVLLLLLSADAVFADMLGKVFKNIKIDGNIFGVAFMIFFVFLGAYAVYCKLCSGTISQQVKPKKNYNAIIAITMNFMLALVYLLFCIIQLRFLFLGENMSLPEGYTYAGYARQGFFQLLFVCLINMVLVLFCVYYFSDNNLLKGVMTFITICTYIMIASSALRMKMYIEVFQLSYLRLLVLWGLCIIALVMTGILIYIYQKGFPLFRYSMVVVTILYLALAFARPEYVIAKYNLSDSFLPYWENGIVETDENGNESYHMIDYSYLRKLSTDAAPVLASAISRIDNEDFEKRLTGSNAKWMRIAKEYDGTAFRKYNFSQATAVKLIKQAWYQ